MPKVYALFITMIPPTSAGFVTTLTRTVRRHYYCKPFLQTYLAQTYYVCWLLRGPRCSLAWTMDGRIMRRGIISQC